MDKKELCLDVVAMAGLIAMGALGCSYVQTTSIANIGIPVINMTVITGLAGIGALHFIKKK